MIDTRKKVFDAIIVGAGIIGAACAAALSREGMKVAIIDGHTPASGITSAGMGHVVAMDDSEAQFALTSYSRAIWEELTDSMPVSCEYENCGTLWVAADDEEMEEVRRKADFYRTRGVECEIIDERGVRELEPNLREGLAGGLRVPGDAVLYQPRATEWLLEQAINAGASFIQRTPVICIDEGCVTAGGERRPTDFVIVAAGLATAQLLRGLKIEPKKGHLVITERAPRFIRHQVIELGYMKSAHSADSDSVAFNVQPRVTGQVLIGSSRQPGNSDPAVDFGIVGKMLKRAFEYMPGLRDIPAVRTWTGFRPATRDNLPLVGRHPEFENVFVAAGHEGLGITTATGTAAIIADQIMGREPAIDAAPFGPARIYKR